MRVLHILDSLNQGGAEQLALDLCRNSRAHDLDLTFVALGGGELSDQFRFSGANYIQLQRRTPLDVHAIKQIHRIIKDHQIEVVHSHQAVEGLHAYFATLGTEAKRVLSFHGCIPDWKNKQTLKFLIPRMHANVAVSHEFLRQLNTTEKLNTKQNFRVVYNGVDTKRLQPAERNLKKELGLSADQMLLGMVGNFYWAVRDQLTVCKALSMLFHEIADVHFAFIGGRSEAAPHLYDNCVNYCQRQGIADRVHFLGKRADIPDILNSLDIFIFSSIQEGLPLAVLEAMLMGLPTVTSDIPPLREVTEDGQHALIFEKKNPVDLARKLRMLINQPETRRAYADAAHKQALENFSIDAHIRTLKNLYDEVVNNRN